uniref:Gag polyprotein n=1 Tax=Drosophila buzzatii TaxID=7264 RepID=A1BPH0_DROBU|nr:gag polyprotein [Drosophila buzzatii]
MRVRVRVKLKPRAQTTRGRPRATRAFRGSNPQRSQQVDYNVIQNMIEGTVTRIMSSLAINNRPSLSEPMPVPNMRDSPSIGACSLNSRRTVDIMQKWGVHFDGSSEGLGVNEFIYRVKSLTDETLESDFAGMCKNIFVLFSGKARSWYWRYHKQVDRIIWSDLCSSLRQQYDDYRSNFMNMEMIRARKQKTGESFSSFYEAVASLIDKSSLKVEEEELMEILKNNLLPETREKLLYQPVHSVGHLRLLVQMSENLSYETSCRLNQAKSKQVVQRRQVYSVEETVDDAEDEPVDVELAAIRASHEKLRCWNCEGRGHIWENCLSERRIFCYGC